MDGNFWKTGRRLGQKQKKEKTEGATGLRKITREQIERYYYYCYYYYYYSSSWKSVESTKTSVTP